MIANDVIANDPEAAARARPRDFVEAWWAQRFTASSAGLNRAQRKAHKAEVKRAKKLAALKAKRRR